MEEVFTKDGRIFAKKDVQSLVEIKLQIQKSIAAGKISKHVKVTVNLHLAVKVK